MDLKRHCQSRSEVGFRVKGNHWDILLGHLGTDHLKIWREVCADLLRLCAHNWSVQKGSRIQEQGVEGTLLLGLTDGGGGGVWEVNCDYEVVGSSLGLS